MAILQTEFEVVGANAGKTGVYFGHIFQDGKSTIILDDMDMAKIQRMLGKFYNAYPVGPLLEAARERVDALMADTAKEKGNGGVQVHKETKKPKRGESLQSKQETKPDGGSSEGAETANGAGTSEADKSGEEPSAKGGDGPGAETEIIAKVVQALDLENDSLWTAQGQPKIQAVEKALGRTGLKRKEITAAESRSRKELAKAA